MSFKASIEYNSDIILAASQLNNINPKSKLLKENGFKQSDIRTMFQQCKSFQSQSSGKDKEGIYVFLYF